VSDTDGPLPKFEKVEPTEPRFQLGIQDVLHPASRAAALTMTLTCIKRDMTAASLARHAGRIARRKP